jgi:hypothetical protein
MEHQKIIDTFEMYQGATAADCELDEQITARLPL